MFAVTQSVDGFSAGWMMMAPALVLLVPLLAGRFLGEERIERWSLARRERRVRPVATVRLPRPARDVVVVGVQLAARAAGRAPPAVVPAA